jgi:hypothetical protein
MAELLKSNKSLLRLEFSESKNFAYFIQFRWSEALD